MARTLILNISAETQVLPAVYGSFPVAVGHGRVVSDESSLVVSEMGGFADMDGKWAVSAISTDTPIGDLDVAANGVAMLATFVPSGGGGGGPVTWNLVTDKPAFATVATSGSYTDLINKPALADVATSGEYGDLSGAPAIPAASNTSPADVSTTGAAGVGASFARGDHQHAHGSLAGGSLHSTATTIAAGFMSAADKSKLDGLASVATSGSYSDLSGTPALFSGAYADLTGKPSLFSGAYNDLTGKPSLFSGSYADLTNTPSLFSGAYNDLTGKPSLSTVATSGAYADLSGKPSLATVATSGSFNDLSNKPTKTYDIASYASGTLTSGTTIAQVLAPKNLTLTGLTQSGGATVVVKVNGTNASYPQSVTSGQTISVVVTVTGIANTFTISAVEA